MVDTEEIDLLLSRKLAEDLKTKWPNKTKDTQKKLDKLLRFKTIRIKHSVKNS